jgi:hypothetical protein
VTTLPDPATSPLRSASGQRSRRFSPPRLRGLLLFCNASAQRASAAGTPQAPPLHTKAGYDLPCSTGRTAAPSGSTPRLHRDPVPADRPVKIASPACSNPICMQRPGPSLRPAQRPSIAPAGWQQLPSESPPPSTASLHHSTVTEDAQPSVHHLSIVPYVPAPIHRPPRQPITCPSQTREPELLRQRSAAESAAGPDFLGPTPANHPACRCMQIH